MTIEKYPNGKYRARVTVKGKRYQKYFHDKNEAELWQAMVKKRRGLSFDNVDKKIVNDEDMLLMISKQIGSSSKSKQEKVLDELMEIDGMTGREFEKYCITLFELSEFFKYAKYNLTKTSGDYGADIIIETTYGEKIGVQCKRLKNASVRIEAIQEIVGSERFYHTKHSMVITNSRFTESAKDLAIMNKVLLIDRDGLMKLIGIKNNNIESIVKKKQWKEFIKVFE